MRYYKNELANKPTEMIRTTGFDIERVLFAFELCVCVTNCSSVHQQQSLAFDVDKTYCIQIKFFFPEIQDEWEKKTATHIHTQGLATTTKINTQILGCFVKERKR